nr:MAG TPA: hypothetical protein [Caudoviricetes sp.]
MLFQLNFPPSAPLPQVRWAFCGSPSSSLPCVHLAPAVKWRKQEGCA